MIASSEAPGGDQRLTKLTIKRSGRKVPSTTQKVWLGTHADGEVPLNYSESQHRMYRMCATAVEAAVLVLRRSDFRANGHVP